MIYSIDRFEGNIAICEDENKKFIEILKNTFPIEIREGDCFEINKDGNIIMLPDETDRRRKEIMDLYSKLLKKKKN